MQVKNLAKQGLIDAAIKLSNILKQEGLTDIPSIEEIETMARASIYDEAQEHFTYDRDHHALRVLEHLERLNHPEVESAQFVYDGWLSRRHLASAERSAEAGSISKALEQFDLAASFEGNHIVNPDTKRKDIHVKALIARAEVDVTEGKEVEARQKLEQAQEIGTPQIENPEQFMNDLIVAEMRRKLRELVAVGQRDRATEIITEHQQRIPSIDPEKEWLIADLQSISSREDIETYVDKDNAKAFAIGGGSWGWSAGYENRTDAIQRALEECQERSETSCSVYAIDNRKIPDELQNDPRQALHALFGERD